jgi:hypothetical protein
MKATEFRIGNLLHDRNGRLCRVEELSLGRDIKATAIVGAFTSLPNKPIELTDEWLTKLGCQKRESFNGWFLKKVDKLRLLKIDGNYVFGYYSHGDFYAVCVVSYVHELQNLYYILTKEELNC